MAGSVRLVFRAALGRALDLGAEQMVLERSFEAGECLADVLARLAAENPMIAGRVYDADERRVSSLMQISVNGRLLSLAGGVEAPLANGDEMLIF